MSAVLRLYGPEECDHETFAVGKGPRPLDWERCRTCKGSRRVGDPAFLRGGSNVEKPCPKCGGHGSLKAAALACVVGEQRNARLSIREDPRCEGCGHPMSDGTWDGGEDRYREADLVWALHQLRQGVEPTGTNGVLWLPCDEGCRHGAPARMPNPEGTRGPLVYGVLDARGVQGLMKQLPGEPVEASWRQVDVRTLGWAFDLRPESLAVLCTRCWAARS